MELPVYNPPRGFARIRILVAGLDTLATGQGPREAWRIRYGAAVPSTFWMDTEHRTLLRSRTGLPDGSAFWRIRVQDLEAWRAAESGSP